MKVKQSRYFKSHLRRLVFYDFNGTLLLSCDGAKG